MENKYWITLAILVSILVVEKSGYFASSESPQYTNCSLWHVKVKDECECGSNLGGVITCRESSTVISVQDGICLTWDDTAEREVSNRCPLAGHFQCAHDKHIATVRIPINASGLELNHITCDKYNRQGTRCRQCKNGYGPTPFSDGFSCTECSKYSHLWLLNLLLQLTLVTLMYLVVILFQIKGTSSPLNIIITYSQLCVCPFSLSVAVHVRMACYLGATTTKVIMTVFGIFNLDFLRFVIPPMCISSSLKSIDTFLFDYIIAFYPFLLTIFIYIGIALHDRNCCKAVYLTIPVKKFFRLFRRNWNPKMTILNTCVTYILLAYSKLLFTSINLLFAVRSYDSDGEIVPNSTVLLYDPEIRLFHSEHIPYAIIALSIVVTFVLLPPFLLILYPTRLFRKFLNCCGFKRWDILQAISDVFQGWYKDGTEGTSDYRAVAALYFLLRVALSCLYTVFIFYNHYLYNWGWCSVGVAHIFLGTFFLIVRPYKKEWMNLFDGLLIQVIGVLILLYVLFENILLLATVGIITWVIICSVSVYKCIVTKLHTRCTT